MSKQPASGGSSLPERNCQSRALGDIPAFGQCLAKDSAGCIYRMDFGGAPLCFNPRWREFCLKGETQR